jgi:hypothetical protein
MGQQIGPHGHGSNIGIFRPVFFKKPILFSFLFIFISFVFAGAKQLVD